METAKLWPEYRKSGSGNNNIGKSWERAIYENSKNIPAPPPID